MSNTLIISKTLIGWADEVASAHEQFTAQYVIGGRIALYNLLGEMMSVIDRFESSGDRDELLSIIKRKLRSDFGIKTQKNSSNASVLIRYMTRTDRKTAHVYSRVIESARASGVKPYELPSFIEGAGGIERVRTLGEEEPTSAQDENLEKIMLTEEFLSCRSELPIASFDANELLEIQSTKGAVFSYFVCARKCDGKFHVLSPLPRTAEFERLATRHLSQLVCEDWDRAKAGVAALRKKADEVIKARFAEAELAAAARSRSESHQTGDTPETTKALVLEDYQDETA